MKKSLGIQNVILLLILLVLFLWVPNGPASAFSRLSQDFFRCLFKNEAAREVFDLEEEEALEVFGPWGEAEWV